MEHVLNFNRRKLNPQWMFQEIGCYVRPGELLQVEVQGLVHGNPSEMHLQSSPI